MRTLVSVLLLTFCFQFVPVLHAVGFDLRGVEVALGMPEETVLKAFSLHSGKLSLHDVGNGYWLVLERQGGKVGGFRIKQGRVVQVSREWFESSTEDAKKLADRIFSAITNNAGPEGVSAKIYTHEIRTPGLTGQEIQIVFPNRRVWITLTDIGGVSVGEAEEEPAQGKP